MRFKSGWQWVPIITSYKLGQADIGKDIIAYISLSDETVVRKLW